MIHVLAAVLLAQATATEAPRVKLSGYAQPQYEIRTTGDETTDRALFRRLVFSMDATVTSDWRGQFQVDVAPTTTSGNNPVIKNAYLQYTGWNDRGLTLTIGNQKMPVSRPLLMSSSRRGLIERPFTGDRAYGSPGRALSVKLEGMHRDKRVQWSAALGDTRQVPRADEIRIEGATETGGDGNQGPTVGGRLEFHPLGETPRDQGDFDRGPLRVAIGAGAYRWWNDDDVGPHGPGTVDAARAGVLEISGALRGGGWSFDAEYERVAADAVTAGTSLGLYREGRARLHKASVEGGYMLLRGRLEALASYDLLDSLSYGERWRRIAAGMNWYMKGHDLKVSLMHRESFDERGVRGARSHATFVQTQLVF